MNKENKVEELASVVGECLDILNNSTKRELKNNLEWVSLIPPRFRNLVLCDIDNVQQLDTQLG